MRDSARLIASALLVHAIHSYTIRNIWNDGGMHSEGPHWSVSQQSLYWVDIFKQNIHKLDTITNNVTTLHISYGEVSPVIPVAGSKSKLIAGIRSEVFIISMEDTIEGDSAIKLLTAVDIGKPDNRMNDGKVDKNGRLWIGTMSRKQTNNEGSLYLITDENYLNPEVKIRPVSISNGLAWTKDDKLMFYIDSPTRTVQVFDYQARTASIRNGRVIFDFAAYNVSGVPDGMTIDSTDNLWVAVYDGACILHINSQSGTLIKQYKLPVTKVTSAAWGGPNLDRLYVTTSRENLEANEQPEAGSVFVIENTGYRGLPANEFKLMNAKYY